MSAIALGSISPLSRGIAPPSLAGIPKLIPKLPGRGAHAARDFEASLIGSLLESMEKTFAALPGDSTVPGADDYNYLGSQALAQGLADRGGFGIAAMISEHLPAHEGNK